MLVSMSILHFLCVFLVLYRGNYQLTMLLCNFLIDSEKCVHFSSETPILIVNEQFEQPNRFYFLFDHTITFTISNIYPYLYTILLVIFSHKRSSRI